MNSTVVNFYTLIFLFFIGCNSSNDLSITKPDPNEPTGEFLDEWTYKVFPKSTDNFDVAEFRLWLPENRNNIRAIIILCHSRNSNGLGLVYTKQWQEYAINKNLGLLSVHFKGSQYTLASGRSGNALLHALEKITKKHNLLEVNNLPFLLRGFSAGGSFSYNFSEFKPKRVICFVNIRGSIDVKANSKIRDIPSIQLEGELEFSEVNIILNSILHEWRKLNHLFGYAVEPNVGHYGSLKKSDALVRSFFTAALTQRLSEGTNDLNIITESTGWLGDNATINIFPFNNYPNAVNEASWLIDEDFAKQWKAYQME